jgi:plasmid segregation protein ParM
MVSGLPVAAFYRNDGQRRQKAIQNKRDSLKVSVKPVSLLGQSRKTSLQASVAFHEVIPEALAAWYDHVIVTLEDGVTLDADRLSAPVAIVDIGGRTTDYVVVQDQGVVHGSSGSLTRGMLDVQTQVANGIQEQFDLDSLGEQRLAQAVETHCLRLHGKDHDVSALVCAAKRELVERLYSETRRQLGLGAELDSILFVGGGSAALATDIANWFPNQQIADHAAFANARGMLKYLQFVCDESAIQR